TNQSFDFFYEPEKITFFNNTFNNIGFEHVIYSYPYLFDQNLSSIISDSEEVGRQIHYSSKGNLLLAKIVYNALLDNQLIPSCQHQSCEEKKIEILKISTDLYKQ
nr:hypothetical protein [Nanoarchaeota archaeon]